MDILNQLGPLALGSRLKRVSDRLMQDGIKVYRHSGRQFEPKWFPVYYYLSEVGPSSVMEIARGIGITHPSVNQIAREMIAQGFVAAYKDPKDKRKRVLALSKLGKSQREELKTTWAAIEGVLSKLLNDHCPDLLDKLGQLEGALDERSFEQRYLSFLTQGQIKIVPFNAAYAADFKRINQTWIEEYFVMEDADFRALDNPESYILEKGGEILFAVTDQGEVIGTCALVRHSSEVGELAKMGVDKHSQTKGAGQLLGRAILDLAVAKGFRTVFLETNSVLEPALKLYHKLGFKKLPAPHPSDYERADVYMEWQSPQH